MNVVSMVVSKVKALEPYLQLQLDFQVLSAGGCRASLRFCGGAMWGLVVGAGLPKLADFLAGSVFGVDLEAR